MKEYTIYTLYPDSPQRILKIEECINNLAAEGWALVAVDNSVHYFEREKKEATNE